MMPIVVRQSTRIFMKRGRTFHLVLASWTIRYADRDEHRLSPAFLPKISNLYVMLLCLPRARESCHV